MNVLRKIDWKTDQNKERPSFIKESHIELWNKQKGHLAAHEQFKDFIYFIEWPEYLSGSKPPEEPKGEVLTEWEKHPLLKDSLHPVRVDIPTVWVKRKNLLDIMHFLKTDPVMRYSFLLDLTAADFLNSPEKSDMEKNQGKRFQMIYLLRSLPGYLFDQNEKYTGLKLRIIVPVDEDEKIPSLVPLWIGADWPEREVFDLMGLEFEGHPNLKRILMPDEYKGHPLRKDFPLKGIGEDYLIQDLLEEHLLEE